MKRMQAGGSNTPLSKLRLTVRWWVKMQDLPDPPLRLRIQRQELIRNKGQFAQTSDTFWIQSRGPNGEWIDSMGPSLDVDTLLVSAWQKQKNERKQRASAQDIEV